MNNRPRARDIGIEIGVLPPGKSNGITDVSGVKVGHVTIIKGKGKLTVGEGPIRTGVTAILPHSGDIFKEPVRAANFVINGYGKTVGLAQIDELGIIETPILLTSTLSVWLVANALVDYILRNNSISSINPVVGECNDGYLNDAIGRHAGREHVFQAIENASSGPVEEGSVGAGTGMRAFGFKSGVGTASRIISADRRDYCLGTLVVNNLGGSGKE